MDLLATTPIWLLSNPLGRRTTLRVLTWSPCWSRSCKTQASWLLCNNRKTSLLRIISSFIAFIQPFNSSSKAKVYLKAKLLTSPLTWGLAISSLIPQNQSDDNVNYHQLNIILTQFPQSSNNQNLLHHGNKYPTLLVVRQTFLWELLMASCWINNPLRITVTNTLALFL